MEKSIEVFTRRSPSTNGAAALSEWEKISSTEWRTPTLIKPAAAVADMVVLCHLRWDFVFQRPQQLMSRFATQGRVYFVEEPFLDSPIPHFKTCERQGGVTLLTPHLPSGTDRVRQTALLRQLLDRFLTENNVRKYHLWYYTPMALPFTRHLSPDLVVYDCMDELSHFKLAPPELGMLETELFRRADIVFTGGHSLYEKKRSQHRRVSAVPSSVDVNHFNRARRNLPEATDQCDIPHPRIGYFGVLDERLNFTLLRRVAEMRPDWHFVMVGPICKIGPEDLPQLPNIHYLGGKSYAELPQYLHGWDVAIMPFAKNEATLYISPTKTPEYLAAGKPVVSTSITDVVRPYGEQGLVCIADEPADFVKGIEKALKLAKNGKSWLAEVDAFLAEISWDKTCRRMKEKISLRISEKNAKCEEPPKRFQQVSAN